jgi:hypothetical protein
MHSAIHVCIPPCTFDNVLTLCIAHFVCKYCQQVLYNNFIPISMYVTVEIVVFIQLYFINNDRSIYSAKEDMPAKVTAIVTAFEVTAIVTSISTDTSTDISTDISNSLHLLCITSIMHKLQMLASYDILRVASAATAVEAITATYLL